MTMLFTILVVSRSTNVRTHKIIVENATVRVPQNKKMICIHIKRALWNEVYWENAVG